MSLEIELNLEIRLRTRLILNPKLWNFNPETRKTYSKPSASGRNPEGF